MSLTTRWLALGVALLTACGESKSEGGASDTGASSRPALSLEIFASRDIAIAPIDITFAAIASGGEGVPTYAWDFGDGATSSEGAPTHTFGSAGTYLVTCTATDAAGTTVRDALQIVLGSDSVPAVVASAERRSGLAPLTVDFTCEASGGNGPLTYAWTFGDGSTSALSSPSHTYASAGTFTATCTATDVDGDSDSDTVAVTATTPVALVISSATATPSTGLAPLATQLDCAATGDAPISLRWEFGNGVTLSGGTQGYTYTTAGAYPARCVATDASGETATRAVTITVIADDAPRAIAGSNVTSGTSPLAVAFVGSGAGGNPPLTFAWSFGDGSDSTSASPSHIYSAGAYVARLTVTDADGDTDTALVNIVVGSDATPSVLAQAGSTTVPQGEGVSFSAQAGGGNPPYSFLWDFDDGGSTSVQSPSHAFTTPGVYDVAVTVTDADGDSASQAVRITVEPDVTVTVTPTVTPLTGRAPLAVSFSCAATGNGPLSYRWSFGNGVTADRLSASHTYLSAGSYTATCTATDVDGDTSAASATVVVAANLPATAAITASATVGEAPLEVDFAAVGGGDAPLTYAWDFGDGATSASSSPTAQFTSPGNYVVRLTVTDSTGDLASSSTVVSVSERNDPPSAVLAAARADFQDATGRYFLRGHLVLLDARPSQSGQGQDDVGDEIISYSWSFDTVPAGSAAAFSRATIADPYFVPDVDGLYVARVTVMDTWGQLGTAAYEVLAESACYVTLVGDSPSPVPVDMDFAPIEVSVTTAHGIPAASHSVSWSGEGVVIEDELTGVDSQGQSANVVRAGTRAGVSVVSARAPSFGCPTTSMAVTVLAGSAHHAVVEPPSDISVDALEGGALALFGGYIVDQYDNPTTAEGVRLILRSEGDPSSTSVYFASVATGAPIGPLEERDVSVEPDASGAFAVRLGSIEPDQTRRAEWYDIEVTGLPGPAISSWRHLLFEDFEQTSTPFFPFDDWEWGAPTSGPGAAFSGDNVMGTRLAGDHDLLWGQRSLVVVLPLRDEPVTAQVQITFEQWYDTAPSECPLEEQGRVGGYLATFPPLPAGTLVTPEHDGASCSRRALWGGQSNGWKHTVVGPFSIDDARWYGPFAELQWVFDDTGAELPRPGWYLDDVSVELRYVRHVRGHILPGAPAELATTWQGKPEPLIGYQGTVGCELPLAFSVEVRDQFGNRATNDSSTTFSVTLSSIGSTSSPFLFAPLWQSSSGWIMSGEGTATVVVQVQGGYVTLLGSSDNPDAQLRLTVTDSQSVGLELPAPDILELLASQDADADGYSLQCGDCDDSVATGGAVYPGADENCADGRDNDCDLYADCNDSACYYNAGACGPLGSEVGCGGRALEPPWIVDSTCSYADDGRLHSCGTSGGSGTGGNDAVYDVFLAEEGEYEVCVNSYNDTGSFSVRLNCGDPACVSGCQRWYLAGESLLTFAVESYSTDQCGSLQISVMPMNGSTGSASGGP